MSQPPEKNEPSNHSGRSVNEEEENSNLPDEELNFLPSREIEDEENEGSPSPSSVEESEAPPALFASPSVTSPMPSMEPFSSLEAVPVSASSVPSVFLPPGTEEENSSGVKTVLSEVSNAEHTPPATTEKLVIPPHAPADVGCPTTALHPSASGTQEADHIRTHRFVEAEHSPEASPLSHHNAVEEEQEASAFPHAATLESRTSSTFEKIAFAVSEFQMKLHDSVISTTLESSAAALADTLQQLLWLRKSEKDAFHEEQQRNASTLRSYREAMQSLTAQARRERERNAAPAPLRDIPSLEAVEERGEGPTVEVSSSEEKEHLFADYVHATGRIQLLEQDVRHTRGVNQQLRSLLKDVVEENNTLREQLTLLQVSTVARKDYDEEVRQHQTVKHELESMKVEVQNLDMMYQDVWKQHESLLQEQELVIQQYKQQLDTQRIDDGFPRENTGDTELSTEGQARDTKGIICGGNSASAYTGASSAAFLWSEAVKQVEARAHHMLTHDHLEKECLALKAEVVALECAQTEEIELRKEREKEVNRLSLDSQALLFRNHVLSHQLASLLEKVEQLERRHRVLMHGDQGIEEEKPMESGEGKADASPVWSTSSPEHSASAPQPASSSTFQKGGGATAAAMASALLHQRTEGSDGTLGARSAGKRKQKFQKRTSIDEEEERKRRKDVGERSTGLHSAHMGGSIASLMYTAPLDTPLEISSTLEQQLSSFTPASRRTKAYTLRNLCFSEGEENEKSVPYSLDTHSMDAPPPPPPRPVTARGMACETDACAPPCVPHADGLSGVAWNHPPSYALVDARRGTIEARAGYAVMPTNLLYVEGVEGEEEAHGTPPCRDTEAGKHRSVSCPLTDAMDRVGSTVPSSLDRYTVHSVESLVQRNQELLSQLYRVTQRATAAERWCQQSSRWCANEGEDGDTQRAIACARVSPPAFQGDGMPDTSLLPTTSLPPLDGPTEDPFVSTHREDRRASSSPPLENGGDEGERFLRAASTDMERARSAERQAAGDDDSPEKAILEVEKRILDVTLADHLRQWQEEHDHLLSTHLLGVLKEVHAPPSNEVEGLAMGVTGSLPSRTNPTGDAADRDDSGGKVFSTPSPVLLALVDLCCSQAIQIATGAVPDRPRLPSSPSSSTPPKGKKHAAWGGTDHAVSKARAAVLQSFRTNLQSTLVHIVSRACENASWSPSDAAAMAKEKPPSPFASPTSLPAEGSKLSSDAHRHPSSPTSGTVDPAQVELLQHVLQLFQTASRKEDLLQQVLRYSAQQKGCLGALLEGGTRRGKKPSTKKKKKTHRVISSEEEVVATHPLHRHSRAGGRKRWRTDDDANARPSSPESLSPAFSPPPASPASPPTTSSPSSPAVNLVPSLLLFPSRGAHSPLSPMSPLPPTTAVGPNEPQALFPSSVSRREGPEEMDQYTASPLPSGPPPSSTSPSPETHALPTAVPPHARDEPSQPEMENDEEDAWEEEDEEEDEEEEEAFQWKKYLGVSTGTPSASHRALLEERLAFQQAQRQQLLTELEEEKKKHIVLLEHLWKVEWERDKAVEEVQHVQESMGKMIPHDVHQLTLTKLAEADQQLAACQAQLVDTEAVVVALRKELDDASEKSRDDVHRHDACVEALQTALHAKDQQLEALEKKMAALEEEESELQRQCVSWQERSAKQNTVAESLERQVRGMEGKMHHLQIEFLSRSHVQALLSEMLPAYGPQDGEGEEVSRAFSGDENGPRAAPSPVASSFLAHHTLNRQLIQDMREERDKLTKQVTHNQLYIQRLEDNITQLQQRIQESQQQQQMTQLEILLQWQSFSRGETPKGATGEEGMEGGTSCPHTSFPSPSSTAISTLASMSGGGGGGSTVPLASGYLERRIQELEGDVSYLRQEVKILEDKERGFKERETILRAELDIMSKDPVSENARRYGLSACQSLTEQCAATQAQNTALLEQVAALTQSVEASNGEVAAVKATMQQVEEEKKAFEHQLQTVTDHLTVVTQEKEESLISLFTAQETLSTKETEVCTLTTELEKRQQTNHEAHSKVEKFRHDNLQLITQVEQLLKDLQDAAEREKEVRGDLHRSQFALRQVREEADVAVAEARQLSSMCVASEGGGSGRVRKTSGSSTQARLRTFPVSVTHRLRDDSPSFGKNGTP